MDATEASWLGMLDHARTLDPDPELADLSDAELERQVRDQASWIAAMQARWLVHLSELIVRGVWADQGARTPGQWLSWACGMHPATARQKARVALALRHLPKIRARFLAGTLSYSKVRALTAVAVPEIEDQLLAAADAAPASQLDKILSWSRRSADELVRWQDGPPAQPSGDVRDLRRVVVDADTIEFRLRLPTDTAMAVEEHLDRLVDLADRLADGDTETADVLPLDADGEQAPRARRAARRAQALADALATAVAAGPVDRSGTDDHQVVLHVQAADLTAAVQASDPGSDPAEPAPVPGSDPAEPVKTGAGPRSGRLRAHVTTNRGRGMMLPRRILAMLTCDTTLRLAGGESRGHPADIGRRSRTVPADLRRALQLRDRHCRFPGCHTTRGLHAHHVVHWAQDGPTDLSNLILLCAFHHRFVHRQGWQLHPVPQRLGRWTFHSPGSTTPHPAVLPMPEADPDTFPAVDADPPPPTALQPPEWYGDGYDLDETIRVFAELLLDVAA